MTAKPTRKVKAWGVFTNRGKLRDHAPTQYQAEGRMYCDERLGRITITWTPITPDKPKRRGK